MSECTLPEVARPRTPHSEVHRPSGAHDLPKCNLSKIGIPPFWVRAESVHDTALAPLRGPDSTSNPGFRSHLHKVVQVTTCSTAALDRWGQQVYAPTARFLTFPKCTTSRISAHRHFRTPNPEVPENPLPWPARCTARCRNCTEFARCAFQKLHPQPTLDSPRGTPCLGWHRDRRSAAAAASLCTGIPRCYRQAFRPTGFRTSCTRPHRGRTRQPMHRTPQVGTPLINIWSWNECVHDADNVWKTGVRGRPWNQGGIAQAARSVDVRRGEDGIYIN